jgi:hypothetical protein
MIRWQEAAFVAPAQPRIDATVRRESAERDDTEPDRMLVHEEMLTPGLQILRGGFGVIGISGGNNVKSSGSQSNLQAGGGIALGNSGSSGAVSGASTPRGGTAFTKIVYAKVPGEIPKTVEVAGSWSKFKQRNAMTKNSQGVPLPSSVSGHKRMDTYLDQSLPVFAVMCDCNLSEA